VSGLEDSDADVPVAEGDYQSGNSSDAEEWDEPPAAPVLTSTPTSTPFKSAPAPVLRPPEAPRALSPTPPSLASKLLQPVNDSAAPEQTSAPPTVVPVYAKRAPLSSEDLGAGETRGALSSNFSFWGADDSCFAAYCRNG
jgi:hypothetical protein